MPANRRRRTDVDAASSKRQGGGCAVPHEKSKDLKQPAQDKAMREVAE
jgi:hypothetical protein